MAALEQSATKSGPAPVSDAYVPPPPAPPAAEVAAQPTPSQSSDTLAPLAKAGESISGFFSNMFGQSSPPPPQQPQTTTTGSTAADGAGWEGSLAARPTGPSAQVSASEPQRADGFTAPQVRVAHEPAAARTAPKTSASGKYRLQLASVRSREEADRLVQQLLTAHGQDIGGAEPVVDETVIGNMGTFYRVRIGPYADASEPKKLCSTLKPQGFDCQVVTQ